MFWTSVSLLLIEMYFSFVEYVLSYDQIASVLQAFEPLMDITSSAIYAKESFKIACSWMYHWNKKGVRMADS